MLLDGLFGGGGVCCVSMCCFCFGYVYFLCGVLFMMCGCVMLFRCVLL